MAGLGTFLGILLATPVAWARCHDRPFADLGFVEKLVDIGNVPALIAGVVIVVIITALRRSSRRTGLALLGITLVALIVRLLQSDSVPMTAWPYTRMVPFANNLACGSFGYVADFHAWSIFQTSMSYYANLVMAVLTPAVVFAHARALFGDEHRALAAAAILALLPMHIRFSASDVHFIQSMMMSSLVFALLYDQLKTRHTLRIWTLGAAIALLSIGMYQARPLNVVFAPLFAFAILVTSGPTVPRRRRLLTLAMVLLTSSLFFVYVLLPSYSSQVSSGLSMDTLATAAKGLVDTSLNTLINPSATPLGLTVIAVIGGVSLYRQKRVGVLVFLLGWLVAFYLGHSIITPIAIENQARYHMHIVVPFVLLASASVPWFMARPRWIGIAVVVYLAASPLLHNDFIRAGDYTIELEYDFLDEVRDVVPEGCVIAEYDGYSDSSPLESKDLSKMPTSQSRVARMAMRVAAPPLWQVVDITAPRTGMSPPGVSTYTLFGDGISAVASEALAGSPSCAYYYEGYACRAAQTRSDEVAKECAAMHQRYDLVEVTSRSVPFALYDRNEAPHCHENQFCRSTVQLTLYQVLGPASEPPSHRQDR